MYTALYIYIYCKKLNCKSHRNLLDFFSLLLFWLGVYITRNRCNWDFLFWQYCANATVMTFEERLLFSFGSYFRTLWTIVFTREHVCSITGNKQTFAIVRTQTYNSFNIHVSIRTYILITSRSAAWRVYDFSMRNKRMSGYYNITFAMQ